MQMQGTHLQVMGCTWVSTVRAARGAHPHAATSSSASVGTFERADQVLDWNLDRLDYTLSRLD